MTLINIKTTIDAPINEVWNKWIDPKHVIKWNHASDDWHTISCTNDLKITGEFKYRMEAKDKSFGFDFKATYDEIIPNQKLNLIMEDGRSWEILFQQIENKVLVIESFEAEMTNPINMQKAGWQSILNNFKKYCEA